MATPPLSQVHRVKSPSERLIVASMFPFLVLLKKIGGGDHSIWNSSSATFELCKSMIHLQSYF